ncbi:hypothetical protein ACIQMR_14750 [Streptomyces sp. NPDC091376]
MSELVQDPASWRYEEEPTTLIVVVVGDRDIAELEEMPGRAT